MSERPSILFMIADDHRFDAIRAHGDRVVQTPVLDGLVESGVSFGRAHTMGGLVGAVCVPSRAALLTGANAFRASASRVAGDNAGAMVLNPTLATLPATLRRAGYRTHAIGKWHNDKASFAAGFAGGGRLFFGGMSDHRRVPIHDFDPAGAYPEAASRVADGFSTEIFADAAVRFLGEYRGADPFFLYLAFTAPHDPRTPPAPFADRYEPDRIPLPPNVLPEHPFDNGMLRGRDERLAPWPRTPDLVRRHLADYYGMIGHLDAQVGRVFDALAASGRAEETIVVYTADHGLAVGQHGLLGKQNLYEHSVRIPMILSGPGLPAGRRVAALAYLADLFPTLCDLTGTPVPDTVESESLLPLVTGTRERIRDRVFGVCLNLQRMVSDGDWKLIRYYRSEERSEGTDRLQLFHLAEDPSETRDLAADPDQRPRLRQLAAELTAWQRQVGDPLADLPVIPSGAYTDFG